jgi:hypothetical protein
MYDAPPVRPIRAARAGGDRQLFAAYRSDPACCPRHGGRRRGRGDRALRTIGDYIAGMTDRYAIARHEDWSARAQMPEGLLTDGEEAVDGTDGGLAVAERGEARCDQRSRSASAQRAPAREHAEQILRLRTIQSREGRSSPGGAR